MPDLVLADDLSGAAEIAGIAARAGKKVLLCADPPLHLPAADLVVVDTDSRLRPPAEAAARIHRIASATRTWQPYRLFKKVDSVLRGPLREEIDAALAAFGLSRAVLAAANPSRHRVVRDGSYYVDGTPLDRTVFAKDPTHPAPSARVRDFTRDAGHILTPDVTSEADLQEIVATLTPSDLPVGAADFFTAFIGAPPPSPPPPLPADRQLWVCGSPTAAISRHREFGEAAIPFVDPESAATLDFHTWTEETLGLSENASRLAIVAAETLDPSPGACDTIGEKIAATALAVIDRWHPTTIFLEGGATARAVIERTPWRSFFVHCEIAPGIVALQAADCPDAPFLVLKPGSYPWPPHLMKTQP